MPPYQFQLWKISGHLQELPHRCAELSLGSDLVGFDLDQTLQGLRRRLGDVVHQDAVVADVVIDSVPNMDGFSDLGGNDIIHVV